MGKKIAFAADLHFGIQGRLNDLVWATSALIEYLTANDIDVLIILGDVFHDRAAIGTDALCAVHDLFSACKQRGIQIIAFPGNHDMFLKHSWSINSLKSVAALATIVDDVKLINVNGHRFWIMPFIHVEAAYMAALKLVEKQYQDGDVLLTHIGVVGSTLNICFLLKDWSSVSFHDSKFDRVYTGHFHIQQQSGRNVWYPGSIIPFKADEGNTSHGFLVYDPDKRQHEAVDIWDAGRTYLPADLIPPPNFLTIKDTDLPAAKNLLKHNIVRVLPSHDYSPNERQELTDSLLELGSHAVRWLKLNNDAPTPKTASKKAPTATDIFEQLLAADPAAWKGLQPALLRQANADIVKEGDNRYASKNDETEN